MPRLISVMPVEGYCLHLAYDDHVEGLVNLSHLTGKGVFECWLQPGVFEQVALGPEGELRWGEELELCTDALYLRLTGKTVEQAFEIESEADAHAGH